MGAAGKRGAAEKPGYDWMIFALGARGFIERALIDTRIFKGNFPKPSRSRPLT